MIAKRKRLPYMPSSRKGVVKVKGEKTADCVAIGVTWSEKDSGMASLVLGLYDRRQAPPGRHLVGRRQAPRGDSRARPAAPRPQAGRKPRGEPSRWRPKVTEWSPVKPELVVEVRYDKWQKARFRHGTRFLRFRPDKDPEQCTVAQVKPRPKKGDPTVPALLDGARAELLEARSEADLPPPHPRGEVADLRDPSRIVSTVNASGSTDGTSFQASGAETRASGSGRTE